MYKLGFSTRATVHKTAEKLHIICKLYMQSLHYQELWWPIVGEQIECEFNRSYKSKGRIATLWDDIGTLIGIQQCVHCLGAITLPWQFFIIGVKMFYRTSFAVNNQTQKHETFPPQQVA